ncbi:SDR family NAD(P)-dependent oxidoreductase [Streptomyces sp. 6N223]|uniref:SDR family NAD(P)-dependent oxidoreductase n=1 Tax=Streptomyces sp. 6N223 TaxID=3457412 RepID=UPI003FD50836
MEQEQSRRAGDPIAIVGMACRLPGGVLCLDDLASLLADGRDAVTSVPPDRFATADFLDGGRRRPGRTYTDAGGFLDDVTGFDCGYFSWISPREASRMDPQQRLLLELAMEALDDASMDGERLAGTDGAVFIGCSGKDFGALQATRPDTTNAYTMSGTAGSNTANRISHMLDWHGQSVSIDTACSSALTAVHQACEHLRAGRSSLALAGGINVLLDPSLFNGFSNASMLSPTGRCHAFSANADGYVRAEGGGLFLLKPLPVALADRDRVHAVIVASGCNSDGRTAGLALPSSEAQRALLEQVYGQADIAPDRLVYLEAHGTGTAVGDPIECTAIGEALARGRTVGPLPIGSVKSNVGHMETGSGVAGLLKAMLVLRDGISPATLHAVPLNPAIDFDDLHLKPTVEAERLTVTAQSVVGVNSFGFGGANAHVVLAPPADPEPEVHVNVATVEPLPVVVSARTPEALGAACARMAERLASCDAAEFYDIAYTSAQRRTRHPHRTVMLASTPAKAAQALRGAARGERPAPGLATAHAVADGKVAFAFAGNGSQWPGMGADLLAAEPVFRQAVEEVDAALGRHLGWSVVEEMTADGGSARIRTTEVAQPLLFAFQVGLVELLAARGVRPMAVTGHSVGEIAAAYTAGALSLEAAATVVACRSRAQALTAGQGIMAAVGLPEKDVLKELLRYGNQLELAGINSHTDTTVAGEDAALAALGEELTSRGVFFRPLDLDYPFHSRAMDAIEEPLRASLKGLRSERPCLPFASTVIGALLEEEQRVDAAYWWHNVRRPVLFGPAVDALLDLGADVLVDVGPHAVLSPYLQRLGQRRRDRAVAVVRTCARRGDGPAAVRTAVAHVLASGARYEAGALFPRPGRVVDLPAYPWQRERHWNGAPDWWARITSDGTVDRPLLGQRAAVAAPTWHGVVSSARTPWLDDHRVGTTTVLPGTAYLEAVFEAGAEALDTGVLEATDLQITAACVLPSEDSSDELLLQTSLERQTGAVAIASRTGRTGAWQSHARARVWRLHRAAPRRVDLNALTARLESRPGAATEHYAALSRVGMRHGPAFQVITDLWAAHGEVLSAYRLRADAAGYLAHPTLLDGALQSGAPLLAALGGEHPFLPIGIEAARLWRRPADNGFVHVTSRTISDREAVWDLRMLDQDGGVSLELTGCRLRRFDHESRRPPSRFEIALRAAPILNEPAAPLHLPPPQALLASTRAERGRLTAAVDDRYPRSAELNWRLLGHYASRAFAELLPGRDEFTEADLDAAGVRPEYAPMLTLLTRAACDSGTLARCGVPDTGATRWRFTGTRPDPDQLVRIQLRELPDWTATSAVFNRCRPSLAAVLRGAADPREMLFTEADQHLVTQLYSDAPHLRLHNLYARDLVREIVRQWPDGRPLRVLELGAGTGGLTCAVLPELPADRTRYVFTDVSPAFFPRAEARFRAYDFVTYQALDLDRDLPEQGYGDGTFDLVLAANVLHATTDVDLTAERVAGLLTDGGLLLGLEALEGDMVGSLFGLLDEYWACGDQRRGGSPLMSREEWTRCLTGAGFTDVTSTGVAPDPPRGDNALLLARRTARPAMVTSTPPTSLPGVWSVVTEPAARELGAAVAARLGAPLAGLGDAPSLVSADPSTPPRAVVLLDAGITTTDPAAPPLLEALTVARAAALRELAAELAALEGELWLVTPPAGVFPAPDRPLSPADAPMWGLGRVLGTEYPGVRVRRVSLASTDDVDRDADRLVGELLNGDAAPETVLTAAGRFRPCLATADAPARRPSPGSGYRLCLRDPGLAHRLSWVPETLREPAAGELVIEVRAAALNYRDIMIATGLLPDEDAPAHGGPRLGLECAGVVVATGPGVTDFSPGDRVYASGYGCLASRVLVGADQTGRMPDGMRFSEAATLPAVFLTVQYALEEMARLRPGETVLVHGGAGGVGLAAIQYAQHLGAEVVATAGTPAKRQLLHSLGVSHVFDSRDLGFAEAVRSATDGRGVDVVLNSLAGEGIARGLECLCPGGRFVELGKRDLYANSPLLLGAFRTNIAFFGVDVGSLAAQAPEAAAARFAELTRRVSDSRYRPLPHTLYAADRVDEAFQSLSHSKHLGKVVVDLTEAPPVEPVEACLPIAPDAHYLITGGFSGLGAAFAEYLAEAGARHLSLVSRRGADTPERAALVDRLTARGVEVHAHAADVADHTAILRVLAEAENDGHPVRGVIHAAVHIDDAPLAELTPERFAAVLRPKMAGTLVLDQATRERELDFFVVCSSLAALIGNRLQGPYCAANAFGEAVVRDRRRAGLPGLAVEWGSIGGTGITERSGLLDRMERSGLVALDPREGWRALNALASGETETAVVGSFDWHRIGQLFPAFDTGLFQGVDEDGTTAGMESQEDIRARLAALPVEEALEATAEILAELAAKVLQKPADHVDRTSRFDGLGLDSLMVVELSVLVRKRIGCDIAALELTSVGCLDDLARRVLPLVRGEQ